MGIINGVSHKSKVGVHLVRFELAKYISELPVDYLHRNVPHDRVDGCFLVNLKAPKSLKKNTHSGFLIGTKLKGVEIMPIHSWSAAFANSYCCQSL